MVTLTDVQQIASLARLRIEEHEQEQLAQDMNRILDYMAQLNELDTTGIEPLSHVLELGNVMREDVQITRTSHEEALKNAPDADQYYFRVPKVID
jgi:aspartyl-tRNA(Asn)/glutamyl-tRNA(Gln) amidotransferase subunit C